MSIIDNYPTRIEFDAVFVRGHLKGTSITQKMGFMSWDDAVDWAQRASVNKQCQYRVTQIRDLDFPVRQESFSAG
jgi:hypothetical protein